MPAPAKTLMELETKFWQSLVDQDADAALELLAEPALMVSSHGAKMAEQGAMVLTSFELSDMDVVFPNEETAILTYHVRQAMAPRGQETGDIQEMNDTSTWIHTGGQWKCVMHTETPAQAARPAH
jgi:hypothetical protein